eukprot:GEMP01057128.1.p1 GENE.GEMP01057128.1~~GEMP01057128.1.p1  ORF type:complete len:404 (+),score=85.42 GEMP01057128.1:100-1311(+)
MVMKFFFSVASARFLRYSAHISPSTSEVVLASSGDGALWTRCAAEGDVCACPSGYVRFGFDSSWVVEKNAGSSRQCSLDAFSLLDHNIDPKFGVKKECWCASKLPGTDGPYVATVTLTKDPPDLDLWLRYQLGYLGVAHCFLVVQDSATLNTVSEMQHRWQNKITVWESDDLHPANVYHTLMDRQLVAMARAKELARQMNIEWLVHMDDDELLYLPDGAKLSSVFANVPLGVDQVHIPNVEAVYSADPLPELNNRECFTRTEKALTNIYKYNSYVNGKPAARTSAAIKPGGPHMWTYQKSSAPIKLFGLDSEKPFGAPILLVHYESCPISRWVEKFRRLNLNTHLEDEQKIPFSFYRQSMDIVKHCGEHLQDCNATKFWIERKTVGAPKDVMPIVIPWEQILQ